MGSMHRPRTWQAKLLHGFLVNPTAKAAMPCPCRPASATCLPTCKLHAPPCAAYRCGAPGPRSRRRRPPSEPCPAWPFGRLRVRAAQWASQAVWRHSSKPPKMRGSPPRPAPAKPPLKHAVHGEVVVHAPLGGRFCRQPSPPKWCVAQVVSAFFSRSWLNRCNFSLPAGQVGQYALGRARRQGGQAGHAPCSYK